MKRRIAVVAAVLFIFSLLLSSCSPNKKPPVPPTVQETVTVGGYFKVTWQSLVAPEKEDLQEIRLSENAIYFSTYSYSDYTTRLYRIDDGEKTAVQIVSSMEIGDDIAIGSDGVIWSVDYKIVETSLEETETGNLPSPHYDIYLQMIQADGTLGAERLMLENCSGVSTDVQVTTVGVPYWGIDNVLYWAPTGDLNDLKQATVAEGTEYYEFYALGDGGMAVKVYDSQAGISAVHRLDGETGALGDVIEGCAGENVTLYDGSGGYLLVKREGDVVYGLTDGEGWTAIVDLAAYELGEYTGSDGLVGGHYSHFRVMPDGSLLMVERGRDVCRMTPCAKEDMPRTVTVAGCGLGNLSEAARLYNKTQSNYLVRTKDYGATDWEAGLTQLTAELTAGVVPDVLSVDNFLPVRVLIARNALVDLRPYIQNDPVLGNDYFVDGVLDAFTCDGGIYQIAADFTMETVFADADVVGDLSSLTFDAMEALQAAHPDKGLFQEGLSRGKWMSYITKAAVSDFVDWESGTVSFDNGEFSRLITLASSLITMEEIMDLTAAGTPLAGADQSIQQGNILLAQSDIPSMRRYVYMQKLMNSRATFPGYPTAGGNGTVLTATNRFAIMNTAAEPQGAWEFIRWVIQYQNDTMDITVSGTPFPASREAFERAVTYYQSEESFYRLSDADVDMLRRLIANARSALDYDQEIAVIIDEECAKFFRGSCTAEQAAAKIQSRAQLYVSEQT